MVTVCRHSTTKFALRVSDSEFRPNRHVGDRERQADVMDRLAARPSSFGPDDVALLRRQLRLSDQKFNNCGARRPECRGTPV